MSRWDDAETLIAVVEAGGFAAAADRLGVAQSTVSRRIAGLETRLGGVTLVARTTRSVRLTERGERYVLAARRAFAGLARAERELQGDDGSLRGLLHLTLPPALARECLLPGLAGLLEANPELRLQIDLSERYVDLQEEQLDLAVRARATDRSGIHDELLARAPVHVVAAPGYLERAGLPASLAELDRHALLAQPSPVGSMGIIEWLRSRGLRVDDAARVRTSDASSIKALAIAGVGLTGLPEPMIRGELAAGRLVRIELDIGLPSIAYHASVPRERLGSPSLGAVVGALRDALVGEGLA